MKRIKAIGLIMLIGVCGFLLATTPTSSIDSVDAVKVIETVSIEALTKELFGDVKIKKVEYLYNYDDASDYIYVTYKDGGYAVYFKDSMDLMEYSEYGELPYEKVKGKKYYGGPMAYLEKNDIGQFVNKVTNETFNMSTVNAKENSNAIRKTVKSSASKIVQESFTDDTVFTLLGGSYGDPAVDPSLTDPITYANENIREYFSISNQYSSYGHNSISSCGSVAAQILLNYNNYYMDRRIIPDNFLNGYDDANNQVSDREENPNTCVDPSLMTALTVGSRSNYANDSGLTYYEYIDSKMAQAIIFGGIVTTSLETGLKSVMAEADSRNAGTLHYWVESYGTVLNPFNIPLGSSIVTTEINIGRPIIVGTNAWHNSAFAHWMVAYGYQRIGVTNLGYVVDYGYGWGTGNVNNEPDNFRWVDDVWIASAVKLVVDHTHGYEKQNNIIGNNVEYKCTVCGHRILDTPDALVAWPQPVFLSNSNEHGTITASGMYSYDNPWEAFNHQLYGDGDEWSVNATSGWIELKLNSPIYVESLTVFNITSFLWHHTKNAYFTGTNGVALGAGFTMNNTNQSRTDIYVGGVWTDTIRMNITSSYGAYVGASLIVINAKY
jgi:hypothetical protein